MSHLNDLNVKLQGVKHYFLFDWCF